MQQFMLPNITAAGAPWQICLTASVIALAVYLVYRVVRKD